MEIVDCSLAGSNLWILNTLPRSATWANFLCLVPTPTLCNNIGVNIPAVCKHQKYSAARGWWHFCSCSICRYNESLDISFHFISPSRTVHPGAPVNVFIECLCLSLPKSWFQQSVCASLLLVWVLLLHPDNPRDVGSVTQCAGVTAGGIHLHQAD